jgi:hypothetical protein
MLAAALVLAAGLIVLGVGNERLVAVFIAPALPGATP